MKTLVRIAVVCCLAPAAQDYSLLSFAADGGNGFWAIGSDLDGPDRIWHSADGTWSRPVRSPWGLFELAAVPCTRSVWGIGGNADLSKAVIVRAGLIAQAACYAAHAVLATRAEWITNDKALLRRAGLRPIDDIMVKAGPDPASLRTAVESSRKLCTRALRDAGGGKLPLPPPGGLR